MQRPYEPDIEGFDLVERYDPDQNRPGRLHRTSRVLIIGKGNSAFETADALVENDHRHPCRRAASSIRIGLGSTRYVGHLRGGQQQLSRHVSNSGSRQNACWTATIRADRRQRGRRLPRIDVQVLPRRLEVAEADCTTTGFMALHRLPLRRLDLRRVVPGPGLVINDRFPEPDRRVRVRERARPVLRRHASPSSATSSSSTSGFIHGFRLRPVRALHRILDARHARRRRGRPSDSSAVPRKSITDAIIARINRTLRALAAGSRFSATSSPLTATPRCTTRRSRSPTCATAASVRTRSPFVTTLEYGPDHDQVDPFDITVPRIADNDAGGPPTTPSYLHPVVRVHAAAGPSRRRTPPRGEPGEPVGPVRPYTCARWQPLRRALSAQRRGRDMLLTELAARAQAQLDPVHWTSSPVAPATNDVAGQREGLRSMGIRAGAAGHRRTGPAHDAVRRRTRRPSWSRQPPFIASRIPTVKSPRPAAPPAQGTVHQS